MVGGGYRGILAAVPPAQRLRSASGKGAADLKQKQKQGNSFASKLAPTLDRRTAVVFHPPHNGAAYRFCSSPLIRPSVSSPSAFDLDAPPPHAEWRFCVVGNPAWMAEGGGPTEQDRSEGMPSLGEAPNERGKSIWLLCAFQSDPP
jgi:hypothetical protein